MRRVAAVLCVGLLAWLGQPAAPSSNAYQPPWENWVWDSNKNELHDHIDFLISNGNNSVAEFAVYYSRIPTAEDASTLVTQSAGTILEIVAEHRAILLSASIPEVQNVPQLADVVAVECLGVWLS